MDEFGAFGNGVAGGEDDGIGVVANGAGEVVLPGPADFDGFVNRRSQPRHCGFSFAKSQSSIESVV